MQQDMQITRLRAGSWTFGALGAAFLFALTGVSTRARGEAPPESAAQESAEEANRGEARPLGLTDALEVAVRQNPQLARAEIDSKVAKAGILEAAGIDDWVLSANGGLRIQKRVNSADNPFLPETSENAGLSISRNLSTGGNLGLALSGVRSRTSVFSVGADGTPVVEEDTLYSGGVSASFRQPLLRGFGSDVARANQRQAKVSLDAAVLSHEIAAIDVVRQIVAAYWELAYSIDELDIRRSSLALAQEQLRITRAAIDAGAVAPTEALAVEQGIAVREEAILLAEVNVSERSLELRRLSGLEVGPGEIDIRTTDALAIEEREPDMDQAIRRARERNPQLALVRVNGEGAKITADVTKNGMRPRLDLEATGGPTGNSTDGSETLEQIGKFQAYSATVNVTYTQELGGNSAEGAHDRALQGLRRVDVDYEELDRQVAVSMVRAVNLIRAARKRIAVTTKSIELAEQNLRTERARFEAGDATNFDILQRQDELEQAQLSKARAIVDYLNATALYDSLTGDLLESYGIKISEAR